MFKFSLSNRRLSYCFAFFFLLASEALAQQVQFQKSYYYTPVDTVSNQNIAHKRFILLNEEYQTPEFHNKGVYWFRLDILNNAFPQKDLIINIANPHLDSVFLFQKLNGIIYPTDTTGNNFKLKDSTYLRYTRFRIAGDTKTVWLKTRLKKDILFPVTISNTTRFNRAEHLNFFWLGLYYGFVMMVLAINTTFYFTLKDRKFIYYCIFLSLIALTFAYADGLYVLLSRRQLWLNYADLPVQLAVAIAGAVFATNFLELNYAYPRLRWISVALATLMLGCYSIHFIYGGAGVFFTGDMLGLLLLSLYWIAGLFRFKTDVFARFFVFAYGLLLIFAFDFFFCRTLGLRFLNLSPNELKIASILEMIILSFAIVYRVKCIQEEHSYYRKEIQRYIQAAKSSQTVPASLPEKSALVNDDEDGSYNLQQHFGLSNRELEVIQLVVEGLSNQEISDKLFLSVNTVKFHIRNIYVKMDINSRAQAVSRVHALSG